MQRAVQRIRRKLPRKVHEDLSNIDNFSVEIGEENISAANFICQIRNENRPEIIEIDQNESIEEKKIIKSLEPSNFRPMGQKGLEEYDSKK